jgi:hypothetical protein
MLRFLYSLDRPKRLRAIPREVEPFDMVEHSRPGLASHRAPSHARENVATGAYPLRPREYVAASFVDEVSAARSTNGREALRDLSRRMNAHDGSDAAWKHENGRCT